ncbi:MAG: hypothetical protein OXC58_00760, partial [Acidimicrobiaceae bacterium]|nr:hypothetical protein [Acidimicrobiaceae bacterium]
GDLVELAVQRDHPVISVIDIQVPSGALTQILSGAVISLLGADPALRGSCEWDARFRRALA